MDKGGGGGGDDEPWSWWWIQNHYGEIIAEWCRSDDPGIKKFKELILDRVFSSPPVVGSPTFSGRLGSFSIEYQAPGRDRIRSSQQESNEFEVTLVWEVDNPREQVRDIQVQARSLWDAMDLDENPNMSIQRGEMFDYLYMALAEYTGRRDGSQYPFQYYLKHGLFHAYEFLKKDQTAQATLKREVARYNETTPDRVQIAYGKARPWAFYLGPKEDIISMYVIVLMDYAIG